MLVYGLAGPFVAFESFNLILTGLSLVKGSPVAPALIFLTGVFKLFSYNSVLILFCVAMIAGAAAGPLARRAESVSSHRLVRAAFAITAYLLMAIVPAVQCWWIIETPVGVLLAAVCTAISMAFCGSLCRRIEHLRRVEVGEIFA